jgi:hypothetical protein
MNRIPWVVFKTTPSRYLRLVGPFCYPEWTPFAGECTPLTMSQACAWASAYGGIATSADRIAGAPQNGREDPSPITQKEGSHKSRIGGGFTD